MEMDYASAVATESTIKGLQEGRVSGGGDASAWAMMHLRRLHGLQ